MFISPTGLRTVENLINKMCSPVGFVPAPTFKGWSTVWSGLLLPFGYQELHYKTRSYFTFKAHSLAQIFLACINIDTQSLSHTRCAQALINAHICQLRTLKTFMPTMQRCIHKMRTQYTQRYRQTHILRTWYTNIHIHNVSRIHKKVMQEKWKPLHTYTSWEGAC